MSKIQEYAESLKEARKFHKFAKEHGEDVPLFPVACFDIARAHKVHGSSVEEYFQYRFWNKSEDERYSFMTRRRSQEFYEKANLVNETRDWIWINHKGNFDKVYDKFLKRHWIRVHGRPRDEFIEFVQKYHPVYIKGCHGGWGHDIRKVDTVDAEELGKLWDELEEDGGPYGGGFVIEEHIDQSPVTAALHPQSVNTARVVTFRNGDTFRIVTAVLRCGSGDAIIDNHASGGYTAIIDPETGTVISNASGRGLINIETHPDSGIKFIGFQYPDWDQVYPMLEEASSMFDKMHYMGWDVAFLKDGGICLVEGNPTGDTDLLQEPNQIGIRPKFEEMLNELGKSFD